MGEEQRLSCGALQFPSGSFLCHPAAGMNWVAQHVKKNGWRGVVNMSLGGCASSGRQQWELGGPGACSHAGTCMSPSSPLHYSVIPPSCISPRSTALNDAAQQLINVGIPVVTSAGNKYGADACTQSPASNPHSIAVASSDQVGGRVVWRRMLRRQHPGCSQPLEDGACSPPARRCRAPSMPSHPPVYRSHRLRRRTRCLPLATLGRVWILWALAPPSPPPASPRTPPPLS